MSVLGTPNITASEAPAADAAEGPPNIVLDGHTYFISPHISGHDTIPRGALSSNTQSAEVFANPDRPDILLVSTTWYTAADAAGETRHTGYDVYIRYSGALE